MITRTKNIMGVPPAQRQSRDRQQRRKQKQHKPTTDSDDQQQEARSAVIMRIIRDRAKKAVDVASEPAKAIQRQLPSKKRKRPHVDIRI
jgi:hypothetical protein